MLFFLKQKTAYEVRCSDWSSDVCSSDLARRGDFQALGAGDRILDIEHGADRAADIGAIVYGDAAVMGGTAAVALEHDLQGRPLGTDQLDANEQKAYRIQRGRNQVRNPSNRINSPRSEEQTPEPQSIMRHSYAVFCL